MATDDLKKLESEGLAELKSCADVMRDAGRELDHLDPARDRAFGVGQGLAVLLGDDLGEVLLVRLEQLAEAHQHAGTPERRCGPPSR